MIYWVLSVFSLIVPLKNSLKAVMWLNHKTALICVSLLREWYSSLPDGMPWNHCFLYLMYFVCFKCEGKSGLSSVSSVAQSCLSLWDPKDCSMPGFPVHHQLLKLAQTHVHQVGDAIQPSYPLSSPSPPASNLSQHQELFQWVSSSHQVAKVLEFQLQGFEMVIQDKVCQKGKSLRIHLLNTFIPGASSRTDLPFLYLPFLWTFYIKKQFSRPAHAYRE